MAKLYVFGIGGTGARVIKSLTFLFASGCKLDNDFDTVIPVIIDPDTSNGDLNRTKEILRLYQEIRNNIDQPDDFFTQEIKTIANLVSNSEATNSDAFQFQLVGTSTSTFREFIGYGNLSEEDKRFVNELYSSENLKSNLNVGFKGNPNMGSIVLNQFTNSGDFQKFGQSFNPGDSIFIINSIFGGTGAAGFPLLLKSLRNGPDIPNKAMVQDALIGGITYLPYFKLLNGEIDSDTFLEKAKAAIDYYNRTIINTNQINSIYFIGDGEATSTYENHVGEKEQKNDAHFLELAGALAIFDFCNNKDQLNTGKTIIKEFGIENDNSPLTFNSLNTNDSNQIKSHLLKFKLFTNYLENGLKRALNVSRWTKKKTHLKPSYFRSREYENQIIKFNALFSEWTIELEGNKPSFAPYDEVSADETSQFKAVDIANCQIINSVKHSNEKKHTQLIKLFGKTTAEVIRKQKR